MQLIWLFDYSYTALKEARGWSVSAYELLFMHYNTYFSYSSTVLYGAQLCSSIPRDMRIMHCCVHISVVSTAWKLVFTCSTTLLDYALYSWDGAQLRSICLILTTSTRILFSCRSSVAAYVEGLICPQMLYDIGITEPLIIFFFFCSYSGYYLW